MRLVLALIVPFGTIVAVGTSPRPTLAQGDGCARYATQALAQATLDAPDAEDDTRQTLDPDADGITCPDLPLGRERHVPLADELPDDLTEAVVVSITDGDTLKVRVKDGIVNSSQVTIRLIGIDTPETRDSNDRGVLWC